jgi:cardiolipin synthase (CMP-forming)
LREYLGGLRVGLPVSRLAKWKTGFQMTALGMLLAGDDGARVAGLGVLHVGGLGAALLWVAAVLTLVTGWDYLTIGLRHVAPRAAGQN